MDDRPRPEPLNLIYLGGPVDYATHDTEKDWHHWSSWEELGEPYCPRCRCAGLSDDEVISQNRWALSIARLAILDLRSHSIGTPIEMFWRLWEMRKSAVLIARPGSVFIRYTEAHYPAIVVTRPEGALLVAEQVLRPGSWPSLDTGIESNGDDEQRDT